MGFLFGFFFLFFLLLWLLTSNPNAFWIALGSGIGLGVVLGLLLFFIPILALMILAICIGVALATVLYDVAFVYIRWPYTYYVVLGVTALLFLILALVIKRGFIIFMTSFYGSFAIAYGVASFVGGFPLFVDTTATNTQRPANYWIVYIYLGGIAVGTILGMILQFCFFARNITWDQVKSKACPSGKKSTRFEEDYGTPLIEGSSTRKKKSRRTKH